MLRSLISGICIKFCRFFSLFFVICLVQRCVYLCSKTLVSSRHHNSEFMVPGFGRQMQLLRGEVDRFDVLLYTRVMTFQRIDSVVMRVDVVKSQLSSFVAVIVIFMCSMHTGIQFYRIIIFECLLTSMTKASPWIEKRLFCLLATRMLIMRCGLGFLQLTCTEELRVTLSHHRLVIEQMVAKPTNIDGGEEVLDLVLTEL